MMPDFSVVSVQWNGLQPATPNGVSLHSIPQNILEQISAATGISALGNMTFPPGDLNGTFRPIAPRPMNPPQCVVTMTPPTTTPMYATAIASMYLLHSFKFRLKSKIMITFTLTNYPDAILFWNKSVSI